MMILDMVVPTNRAQIELIHIHGNISSGFIALYLLLIAVIIVGMICSDAVFMMTNVIISSVAVLLSGFVSFRCCMAFMPKGVAALLTPSILAMMFIHMYLKALESFFRLGKNFDSTGEKIFTSAVVAPLSSTIFNMPEKKHIVPLIDIIKVMALSALESMSEERFDMLPVYIAHMILTRTIPAQI